MEISLQISWRRKKFYDKNKIKITLLNNNKKWKKLMKLMKVKISPNIYKWDHTIKNNFKKCLTKIETVLWISTDLDLQDCLFLSSTALESIKILYPKYYYLMIKLNLKKNLIIQTCFLHIYLISWTSRPRSKKKKISEFFKFNKLKIRHFLHFIINNDR